VETVNVRYFNIHNDENVRTLVMDRKSVSENQSFNTISAPVFPPYDSVTLQVIKGTEYITYKSAQKFKFARQSNYIMLALPDYRVKSDTGTKYEDTIIYLQTTILKPNDTNQCFIKFLNANPDTSLTYSIKVGCPNGENLFVDNAIVSVSYLQSTGIQAIYEGKRVISIIKNSKNTDTNTPSSKVIGIFELELTKLGQYALVINKNNELFFIDELNANSTLTKLNNVEAKNAYIRTINMSSENITINSSTQGNIASDLNANFIDSYKNITTCDALSLDKLTLESNGTINDSIFISFDIYKKYSIFAFDTKDKVAGRIIAVPPIDDRMKTKSDKAIVRVVNGNIADYGITISIGASNASNDVGYESGTTFAVNLLEGEYSKEMYINGGTLPISVFASTQPTKYLFSAIVNIQNGKEYLITIDGLDRGKVSAVELNDETISPYYGDKGSFLQFVNVCNGNNTLTFTIPNILLTNGKLSSYNLLTTFIPTGDNSVQVSGKTYNFNAKINERTLLIATSTPSNPEIFAIQSENMGANSNELKFRFINASDDTPILQVDTVIEIKKDENNKDVEVLGVFNKNIAFKTASFINTHLRDKKYSFRFVNTEGSILYKADDLLMTLNKNYSIIFYGSKNVGYGIFMIQEY
jgi:hypothetical protein